jgi:DNA-binding response OmpR family regulator
MESSPTQHVVLIAEGHTDTRLMLRELLRIHGFDVVECEDGTTALAETLRTAPDIVLLSGGLPRLDGLRVAREIRKRPTLGNVPILFVSGDGAEGSIERALDAGCDHYLLKPVDLEELVALVTRLAERHASPPSYRNNRHAEHS